MSVGKKLLFSVLVAVAFLIGAETLLWLLGVERLVEREDPFRGFSGLIEIFEPVNDSYRTRPAVTATFNAQSFRVDKPVNGLRLFTLGGSSAYGFPWGASAAFTAILGDALAASHPDREVEAVNVAGVSYAMHRLNIVLDELIEYRPDLVVVYSGHNEFIEPEFFDALKRRSAARNRLEYTLAHSRLYSGMHAAIREDADRNASRDAFAPEVRRDRSQRFDDDAKAAIVEEFRFRLDRLVERAVEAGSRVVLVTVPANLRDWRPEASVLDPTLGAGDRDAWSAAFDRGVAALERGDPDGCRTAFDRALEIAPGHAETHFRLARCLELGGDFDAARRAYASACDHDASPSRRVSAINDAIREVAADRGVLLVDADRIFQEQSVHGLVGFNLIEDYVHPTREGHAMIAFHLWQAIEAQGWFGTPRPTSRSRFESILTQRSPSEDDVNPVWLYNQGVVLENQGRFPLAMEKYREALALDPEHGGAMGNLARLLVQGGRYEEAQPLAERLVARYPERDQFAIVLGIVLLNRGDLDGARVRFEQVLAGDPDSALAQHNLGRVLERQGLDAEARQRFSRALVLRPDFGEFHYRHGSERLRAGDLVRARTHLEFAARVGARPADTQYDLGLLVSRTGDMAAALPHFEAAIEAAPGHSGALVRAAWIRATHADPAIRDPPRALAWARRAAEATGFEDPAALDTLAAASAASGAFDEAARWEAEALRRVPPRVQPQLRARLTLYKQGKAYVEPGARDAP